MHLGTDEVRTIRATEAEPLRAALNISKSGGKAFKPSTGFRRKSKWNK